MIHWLKLAMEQDRMPPRSAELIDGTHYNMQALDIDLLEFLGNRVMRRATPIDADNYPGVKLMLVTLHPEMTRRVCVDLQQRFPKESFCVVLGHDYNAIVVGATEPPEGLSEWIITEVEKRPLTLTV